MITGIQENSIEAADIVIKKVLAQRHTKEIEAVDKEFELEMKEAVDDAVSALMETRDRERDEMVSQHEQALQDLMAEAGVLGADELEEKRREIINEQQCELSRLEQSYARQKQQIEKGTAAELTLKHAKAKLELKEKHYKEFVSALNELTPENSVSRQRSVEQARAAAAELEHVKRRLEEQRKENERKLEEDKQAFEQEQQRKLEEELADYEKELAEEASREEQKHAKSLETLEKRRQEMVKKSREKTAEEVKRLGQQGAAEDELQQLQQKHQEQVTKLTSRMEAEKLRMASGLKEKLAAKRADKRNAKRLEIERELELKKRQHEAQEAAEKQRMDADIAKALQETVENATVSSDGPAAVAESAPITTSSHAPAYDPMQEFDPRGGPLHMLQPLSEEQMTSLLMASPLYQKLDNIKSLILSGAAQPGKDAPKTPVAPGDGYIDPKDVQWGEEKELVPVRVESLNARTFIVYKFGQFVCDLLAVHCQHAPIALLLADKIPGNAHFPRNAYRNSFAYDKKSGILYIRQQRLDNVGEFLLVLAHTLAHIKTNDLRDDSNPQFIREFYRCLAVCCDDLFFARYRRSQALERARSEGMGEIAAGHSILDGLYGSAHTEADKTNVVEDLLDVKLLRGTLADGAHFTPELLFNRMSKYTGFSGNAKLREYLGLVEEKIAADGEGTSEYINKRLDELEANLPQTLSVTRPLTSRPMSSRPTSARPLTSIPMSSRHSGSKLQSKGGKELWAKLKRKMVKGTSVSDVMEEARHKDLYKHFLEMQVNELESRVDNLDIEYATLARESVELTDTMRGAEEELATRNDSLKDVQEDSPEHNSLVSIIREVTGRLVSVKSSLATVEAKKAGILRRMEEFKSQLEDKQRALTQHIQRSVSERRALEQKMVKTVVGSS